jgi:microcystin-dependent protein
VLPVPAGGVRRRGQRHGPAAAIAAQRRDGRVGQRCQAHLNMQPFLAINFCIALQGIFPSRN